MPILCKIHRGDFIESIHVAYAVVVDGKGEIVYSSGDPHYLTCVRSALKPFQASAAIKEGATKAVSFTPEEIALMCASHNGEDIHVNTAKNMLDKIGYDTSYYECGTHFPYDKESRIKLIQNKENSSALHNNCSGKHAGMLCLAKYLQVDPKGYTDPGHKVQQLIMKRVKRFSELNEFPLAIDGCSAPVPFLPLFNIALMYQKLASGNYDELNTLFDAVTSNPYLIAGKNRFDTDFIEAMDGKAVTKVGGEAVRGLGIRSGNGEVFGIALKVLDGNQRCSPIATMAVLDELDLLTKDQSEKLSSYKKTVLRNHRKIETGIIAVEL
jgi:L-asparaginase II